jgi:hypothetical protein
MADVAHLSGGFVYFSHRGGLDSALLKAICSFGDA